MKKLIISYFFMLIVCFVSAQGVTTSAMQGQIMDQSEETLIGATITALHTPTGTLYGTITDENGRYRLDNLKVGGPYKVTISYVGQEDKVYDQVYLRLGEPLRLNATLGESAVALNEIVVTAQQGSVGRNSGTSTQIGTEAIENLPTLNRDLADFTRLTPQASGNSFGGINNRYNAIYVDGAVNNDVFGLADSGTNGGQTGISPFSIDIIDQIQVVLSPYDVTYGGFAGAGINAVTKSGDNNLQGTAYYFLQNQALVGKTNNTLIDRLNEGVENVDDLVERENVDDFTKQTFGASLGGPIIKNKVFFFANVEIQQDETPSPFELKTYTDKDSTRVTEADLNNLSNVLRDQYGYDAGTFGNTSDELKGVKLFGKLDFNLNKDHKLTVRHQYTKAEQFNRNSGNSDNINFSNNGVFFPSITNSSAIELNSNFNNKMSNNLIIGYTTVNDDRDPLGQAFPNVTIEDTDDGSIRFGGEAFSSANILEQKIFTITDNFKIYKGKHTLTFGTHNEFYNIRNVFLPRNFGLYEFDSLDDFLNGESAGWYDRTYSLIEGDVAGDETNAAAEFSAMQLGIYGQDEIEISNKLILTAGLRIDVPFINDDPVEAPRFNDEVLPRLLAEFPDFDDNVEAGKAPEGQIMLSPRIGFNYKASPKNTLRGGVGIFTSRIPFVWPGAMFNTNGVTSTRVRGFDLDSIPFVADVQNQYTNPNGRVPSGDMNLFTSDFKYPQVLKANIGFDTELPGGWSTSFEAAFTKTLNNIRYTNINNSPEVDTKFTGSGDDRPIYVGEELDDDDFGGVYVGSNTNEGYGYNLTASIQKDILPNLNLLLAYNYGDSYALFEGTSSQNSSQWRGSVNVDGRNNAAFGRSDFAQGSKIIGALNYSLDWANTMTTTVSLFYNGQSGDALSYTIGGGRSGQNLNNDEGDTGRNRALIYVPNDANDINLIEYKNGDDVISAATQWENLNNFIENDSHLSERRGDYAEKNGGRAPWVSFLDLAIRQDLGINLGEKTHKFQLSFDVFNLANLLNSNWGVRYNIPGSNNNYELLNFEGFDTDGTTPQYTYRGGDIEDAKDTYNINNFSSRWQARVGVRYIFN